MAKFMVLYRSSISAADQMANATPEEMAAGMDAWMAWAGKAGSALVDFGSPLAAAGVVGDGDVGGGSISGYSVLEAESSDDVKALLDSHPHLMMPGAAIDIHEYLPVPGM